MKIKEQNAQRLVFPPSLGGRLKWVLALLLATQLGFMFPPVSIVSTVISCVLGLYALGRLTIDGRTVIIDSGREEVVVKNRFFFLLRTRSVIPFSGVSRVMLDRHEAGDHAPRWDVSLEVLGGKKIRIDRSADEWGMRSVAQRISDLTGKMMIGQFTERRGFGKEKHITAYDPKTTREQALASWKKRTEKERKK